MCVGFCPQNRKIGSANVTTKKLIRIAMKIAKEKAVSAMVFASFLRFCPFRLATSAEIDTFKAINIDRQINLGCEVSPMEATAVEPRELTIYESTSPTKAIKKDSIIAGHAMLNAVFSVVFLGKFICFFGCKNATILLS